jgi:hypothetical protein
MIPGNSSDATQSCPERDTLLAFSQSSLDLPALDAVARHVSACPTCEVRLRRLEGSSPFVSAFRRPTPKIAHCDERGHGRLESRAAAGLHQTPAPSRSLTALPPDDAPSPVGRYEILGKLGQGGMGTVYQAHDPGLDRIVALKLLGPRGGPDAEMRARFSRELAAAGRLDHPHVARALDCGECDGRPFLVMEYIEGTDLARLIGAAGPLPVADACELARQAAIALHHVHTSGLIHRDVKPSNLMLTPDGRLKVLDLGLARFHGPRGPGEALTEVGQILGTADYLAPEQVSNPRGVDARADLYALGCTLYHLLTGRAPFDGPGCSLPHEKLTAHGRTPPPALRTRRPDVPEAVAAVVHRLLAKDPADRYATAAQVAEALAPHAQGCDLPALLTAAGRKGVASPALGTQGPDDPTGAQTTCLAPPTTRPRFPQRRRRRLWLAGLAAGLLAAGLLAGLFIKWPRPAAATPRDTPLDDLPPLIWHPLLDRPPGELRWSHGAGESLWKLTPERHELWASSPDTPGLLQVGEVGRRGYALRVEINQNGWTGGVGIFFGYAEDVYQGFPCHRYQYVELRNNNKREAGKEFTLCRGTENIVTGPGGIVSYHRKELGSSFLPRPERHDQLLEVEVGEAGLTAVHWNGVWQQALTAADVNRKLRPADYLGRFGIATSTATGVYSNYQIRLSGPRDQ